jgi:D-galactarolactone isomerase
MMPEGTPGSAVPFTNGTAPPKLAMPAHACDCHMHVFEDGQPTLAGGLAAPPAASLEQYARLQRRLGTTRFVNVTPSIYGVNNSALVASLRRAGSEGRGVAVVDSTTSPREIAALHDAGVRGARFNLVQRGATTFEMMAPVAALVAQFGWHLQAHLPPAVLLHIEKHLMELPLSIVLDHIACVGENVQLQPVIEQCLQRMLDSGKAFLKLSGPYFSGRDEASQERLADTVDRLISRHSERLLWGSDWPHGTEANKPDDAAMIDFLLGRATGMQLQKILVSNPVELYDFNA